MRKLLVSLLALLGLVSIGLTVAPAQVASATATTTIYDSTQTPLPGNQASLCFECWQVTDIGNQVAFAAGTPRLVDDVTVTLSSWGCESGTGPTCTLLHAGDTFSHPLTLKLYNVGNDGTSVGSLITSVTQTFAIPYRPSSDPNWATDCPTSDSSAWFDAAEGQCHHGIGANVTFNLGHTIVPDKVIYDIQSNTSDYGNPPYGDATACHSTVQGCPYDSLNVALSTEPTSPGVGSDPEQNALYDASNYQPFYCDPAHQTGVFGLDQGCWNVSGNTPPYNIPSVRFDAVASPAPSIISAGSGTATTGSPFSFTVLTTGVPVPTLSSHGVDGLTLTDNGDGTATLSGTAIKGGVFTAKITASSKAGKTTQNFVLTANQAPGFAAPFTKSVKAGHGFTFQIKTSGYPTAALSGVGLPAWATVTDSGGGRGLLSGAAPVAPGSYPVVVQAANVAGATSQTYTVTVP